MSFMCACVYIYEDAQKYFCLYLRISSVTFVVAGYRSRNFVKAIRKLHMYMYMNKVKNNNFIIN